MIKPSVPAPAPSTTPVVEDNQVFVARFTRELFLATNRDVEAMVYGLSEALLGYDDTLAVELERAMLAVLARRGPRLVPAPAE